MSGHAVVIGGGIGGLLAAHTLARRFERVTILERYHYQSEDRPSENWPGEDRPGVPPARRGAPQGRCLHLLAAAGAAAFDELTPSWREQLVTLGAVPFDASADAAMRFPTGWLPRTASGITLYACSRALLEDVLRRQLRRESTVQLQEGQQVRELLSDRLGERVTGVLAAGQRGGGETAFLADLVVDASGAGSTLPRWIARLPNSAGSQAKATVVQAGRQYVSRWFHLEPRDAPDWHCLAIAPTADTMLRSAMMLRAENDIWGVVLLAPAGEPLPSSDTAFLDFTAGLGDSLRDVLDRAKPVSPIHRYGPVSNRIVHYDRLTTWPAGLVALGDSACVLDPYFGLGMTATARSVLLLRTYLEQQSDGLIQGFEFQKELASLNTQPWQLATSYAANGRHLDCDRKHRGRRYEAVP